MIKSGLAPKIFPSLIEIRMKADASKFINDTKWENRSGGGCNTDLCVSLSIIWKEEIHSIISEYCKYNGINWLRNRIYYHRLPNLREPIQGDLVSKLRNCLASK